jgi:alpha-tubulin suppressor-like RCC1 family protein
MPTFYNFRENGVDYSFDDIFVPADLFRDGNLWTWGNGDSGRLGNASFSLTNSTPSTTFAGGNNWKQINAGSFHTVAIKTDGTLWTWGRAARGRLGTNFSSPDISTPSTTFAGGNDWKQVSGGSEHTVAIKTDGTLWTWGEPSFGATARIQVFLTPVTTFAGGTNWADTATTNPEDLYTLSCGVRYTAAIKTDGTLWTWGRGSNGQLGDATIISVSTPVTTFSGGTNWKQVSSGNDHTAAIKTDGTLWTWGAGGNGRLGNANITDRSTPVTTFAGGTNWKQVGSGSFHTAAVKTDGTLWTWGFKVPLGVNNIFGTNSTPVTTFAGGTNWKQVGGGSLHTAALSGNELFLFGESLYGEIGNAYITTDNTIPLQPFESGTNWKQVSAGGNHTAAIKTDGTLWTWGRGSNGQLGNADVTDRFTPITTFAGGTNWKQVSTIGEHTAAIKTDGTLWTWGRGSNGQLGNAQTTDRSTPVTTFTGGTNWKQVSAGNFHTSAIKTDGTLWGWGSGNDGVLGTNNTFTRSTPVTTFAGGNNWKQVGAGNQYTTAIKTDGTLWTWGYGTYGRLGTNSTVRSLTPVTTFAGGTNWKQVDAGQHTAAIIYDDPVL